MALIRLTAPRRRSRAVALPMAVSSLGLITGKAASMTLGFLFWLLAAREFDPAVVGVAAAAVSAMMLCVQLAMVGAGSAFIAAYPAVRAAPTGLLDTTLSLIAVASTIAAALFLAVAAQVMGELRPIALGMFAPLFVAVTVLGSVGVALDQVSMAFGRGDHVVARNTLGGVLTLAALAGLVGVAADVGPVALFGVWLVGAVAAVALGAAQLRACVPRYHYRFSLPRRTAASLMGTGFPNYVLTLVDRTPALLIPLVVTEVLSAEANAYWYAVWMTAWAVYVVPVSVGTALYAEVCHRPGDLARSAGRAVRTSLAVGTAGAAVIGLAGGHVLSLLGSDYAAAGGTPLRLMLLAVVPLTAVQTWLAVCRARGRFAEAVATGAAVGVVAVASTATAAAHGGLAAMAAAWTGTQAVAGAWSLQRLRRYAWSAEPTPSSAGGAQPACL